MPTHTPSPHRFLAPTTSSSSKPKPKAPSNLRNSLTSATPKTKGAAAQQKTEFQFKKLTPAKRVEVTPGRPKIDADLEPPRKRDGQKPSEQYGKTEITPRPLVRIDPDFETEREANDLIRQSQKTQLIPRPKPKRAFARVESIETSQSSPATTQDTESENSVLQTIEHDQTLQGVQGHQNEDEQANANDQEMLFRPTLRTKRRRLTPPQNSPPSPSHHQQASPRTPITPPKPHTHHFQFKTPNLRAQLNPSTTPHNPFLSTSIQAPSTTTAVPPAPANRPAFLLPALPTSPPKPSKPLPEIFSPSRKSGRYLPAGLASTMTNWIIEMANTGFAAQAQAQVQAQGSGSWGSGGGAARQRDDGVRLRVRVRGVRRGTGTEWEGGVGGGGRGASGGSGAGGGIGGGGVAREIDRDENSDMNDDNEEEEEEEINCFTGGVAFIRGMTEPGMYNASRAPSGIDDDAELRVLLAGQGGSRGSGGVKVGVGSVIGIRQPVWDIEICGEKWLVGVDWMVL